MQATSADMAFQFWKLKLPLRQQAARAADNHVQADTEQGRADINTSASPLFSMVRQNVDSSAYLLSLGVHSSILHCHVPGARHILDSDWIITPKLIH